MCPPLFFAVFIAKLSLKQGYKIAATSKGRLTFKFYAFFHHKIILKTDCVGFFQRAFFLRNFNFDSVSEEQVKSDINKKYASDRALILKKLKHLIILMR